MDSAAGRSKVYEAEIFNNSLIVLYPDQLGEPQDMLSFSNPRGNNEDQHYEKVGKWFYKWFRKSDK